MNCLAIHPFVGGCIVPGVHTQHEAECGCRWRFDDPSDRFFAPCPGHNAPEFVPLIFKTIDDEEAD